MKLTKIDRLILNEFLKERSRELSLIDLSKNLKKNKSQICLKLKRLSRNRIVKEIPSYPKLYSLNVSRFNGLKKKIENKIVIVNCRKCNSFIVANYLQQMKMCNNCHHRFHITEKNINESKKKI